MRLMIRRFRYWLSWHLFALGKCVHPDIGELTADIAASMKRLETIQFLIEPQKKGDLQ